MIFFIIYSAFLLWSFVGAMVWFVLGEEKMRSKNGEIIFLIISGPAIWILTCFFYIVDRWNSEQ